MLIIKTMLGLISLQGTEFSETAQDLKQQLIAIINAWYMTQE